jgi:putative endopeptidase
MRLLITVFMVGGLMAPALAAEPGNATDPPAWAAYRPYGLDRSGADPETRPGDDFFRHANGRWLARTEIPSDHSSIGVNDDLSDAIEGRVLDILERGADGVGEPLREEAAKIGAFYASFMDERRIEALDVAAIAPRLGRIRAARSREELVDLQGGANGTFDVALFSLFIRPDAKTPERYAVHLAQGGLGLPDRDYYRELPFAAEKAAYARYIGKLLAMAGWPSPEEAARAVVAFESRVADASWTAAARRDPDATYNPMGVGALESQTGFPFRRLLERAGLAGLDRVIVGERSAFPEIAAVWARTPLETLKAWQAFGLVDAAAPSLSSRFAEAHFRFHDRTIDGIAELPPRWKRGARAVSAGMGQTIGKIYVARHFSEAARAAVADMAANVRTAMAARIASNPWMEPATKARALDKLAQVRFKLGFPTRWRDTSGLRIAADDLAGNVERSMAFEWQRQVARRDTPVDRDEWWMSPQTVNASFDENRNEVTLPAAQLAPPFFDLAADPAVNYGAIGALLGHELTHGFDDQGRKFDGSGRLSDWWAARDAEEFKTRAAQLGRQYGAVQIFPGAFVNGDLTMGENIADLAGALVALDAYRLSLAGREPPVIEGLSGTQRFFLGYAQSWREKSTEGALRRALVSDQHAPETLRVNGVVRNIDEWYAAFDVRPGDALYLPPEARVRIW